MKKNVRAEEFFDNKLPFDVKRKDLIRHLQKRGCEFVREGSNHTIFCHPSTHKVSTVPRHAEIEEFLAKKICRDLGVEE